MLSSLAAFALFAAILTITPGVDTILVLRTTAVSGRRAGWAATLGIGLGCVVWAVASALGVTAILAASELAFTALRVAGAAYLGWLGVRALLRSRRPPRPASGRGSASGGGLTDVALPAVPPAVAFRTGLVTNLLNPKVGVFYLAVMPQFLPAGTGALAGSLALAGVHVLEGLVWLSLVVLTVNRARRWLTKPAVTRRLEQLTGVAFLAFGLRIALDRTR